MRLFNPFREFWSLVTEQRKQIDEVASLLPALREMNAKIVPFRDLLTQMDFALQARALDLLRPLRPFSAQGHGKIRVGSDFDGGYVCLDDFAGITAAFSCGIGGNDSFDLSCAERGIDVLQFDHTIQSPPTRHPKLRFFREQIVPVPTPGGRTLAQLVREYPGDAPDLLLKIDIEYDEWPVFDAMELAEIGRFRQIVGEFHGFHKIDDVEYCTRMLRVLRKIDSAFFVCHVHANNYSGIGNFANVVVPHTLEITFANRSVYTPYRSHDIFPTTLDAPCDPGRPDYHLGSFWF